MNNSLVLIRINPTTRTIAMMSEKVGKNAIAVIQRLVKAKSIGHRTLLEIEEKRRIAPAEGREPERDMGPTPLVVAGGVDIDFGVPGWRLQGGEATVGISILFGQGHRGGMTDCPVSKEWLEERIVWVDAETEEERRSRAGDAIDLMEKDLRATITGAVKSPTTSRWFAKFSDNHEQEASALVRLSIATVESKGVELSPFGLLVREMMQGGAE